MKDNEFDLIKEGDIFYIPNPDPYPGYPIPGLIIGKTSIVNVDNFIYHRMCFTFEYADNLFSYIMYKDWLEKDIVRLRRCNSNLVRLMYES